MKKGSRADDAASRRLRAAGNPEELDRIMQDECRRRASKKLAATLLSAPDFRFPTELSAEQCTSDALADIHATMIKEGDTVVDLTCGLAIDAFHLARKAGSVLAIDLDPKVAEAVGHNARALGLNNVETLNADCIEWLSNAERRFDVAFIDPARRGKNGQRLFSLSDCQPDVTALFPLISRLAPKLIVKMSPMLDISHVLEELPGTKRIHILGTETECKELVAEIEFGSRNEPTIEIHTLGHTSLSFRRSEYKTPSIFTRELLQGMIIGEPWPSVMKANPRGLLPGEQLHQSTYLFAGVTDRFPGRRYRLTAVEPFSSSNIKRLSKLKIAASVAVRNFPLSADDLRRRLRAGENADLRIIGTTTERGRYLLFLQPLSEQ